jgi:hypothetical protein
MSQGGNSGGGLRDDPARDANEALGAKISLLLRAASMLPIPDERPADQSRELGRLVRAFLGVEDPRIRTEIISLLEAISLLQSENHTPPGP